MKTAKNLNHKLPTILAATAAVIEKFGWTSKGAAEESGKTPTAFLVADYLAENGAEIEVEGPSEEIEKAIAWAKLGRLSPVNDYASKIGEIAVRESGNVTEWELGLVCSILPSYRREISKAAEKAAAATKVNEFVGTEGERITATLTLRGIHTFENQWGTKVLHRFEDAEGRAFVWFASDYLTVATRENDGTKSVDPSDFGRSFNLVGTVKKHSEFRGTKQTELSRVKLAVEKAPKAPRAKKAKVEAVEAVAV